MADVKFSFELSTVTMFFKQGIDGNFYFLFPSMLVDKKNVFFNSFKKVILNS